jgi:DNA-binding NarL/FixJ family response regulator
MLLPTDWAGFRKTTLSYPLSSPDDNLSCRGAPTIMRILLADDNEFVRRGVKSILASMTDWKICGEARSGEEAVQIAEEVIPDLVLLDVSMPGLNGLDAARLLRAKVPSAKILIMSQHDPSILLSRALEAGAHDCVDKSRLSTNLVSAIASVMTTVEHQPGSQS